MEFNFWHGMNNDFLLLANYNTPKEANQIVVYLSIEPQYWFEELLNLYGSAATLIGSQVHFAKPINIY